MITDLLKGELWVSLESTVPASQTQLSFDGTPWCKCQFIQVITIFACVYVLHSSLNLMNVNYLLSVLAGVYYRLAVNSWHWKQWTKTPSYRASALKLKGGLDGNEQIFKNLCFQASKCKVSELNTYLCRTWFLLGNQREKHNHGLFQT